MPSRAKGTAHRVGSWELQPLEMAEEAYFNLRASYRLIRRPADSGVRAGLIRNADHAANAAKSPYKGKRRLSCQEVMKRLERILDRGNAWTSYRRMAQLLGYSVSTIHKVVRLSPKLTRWMKQSPRKTMPAKSLTRFVADNTPQGRESDPADMPSVEDVGVEMARLIDQAGPKERAKLNALDEDGRRELVRTFWSQQSDDEQNPMNDSPSGKTQRQVTYPKRV